MWGEPLPHCMTAWRTAGAWLNWRRRRACRAAPSWNASPPPWGRRPLLAKELLVERQKSISQVAAAVGYDAEAAFNRAFKREFGVPPARWRDQQAAGAVQ
jgi:helix-turn-helix protein